MTDSTMISTVNEGIIGWFARNHVAANLLMLLILGAGLYTLLNGIQKETMPEFSQNQIRISIPLRGGTPEEVEEGVLIRIEEAVNTIEGIARTESQGFEGAGVVVLNIADGYVVQEVLDEVQLAVDSISGFPSEAERPQIRLIQGFGDDGVINVQVYGDIDVFDLQDIATDIRNEILELPSVSQANLEGISSTEISVEVSAANLRRYNLTLDAIAGAIRQWSVDLPGGGIRTEGGYIRVRAKGQAYTAEEFSEITLIAGDDGRVVKLGDVATIIDGYSDTNFYSFFNGQPSIGIAVDAGKGEDALQISEEVRNFVKNRKLTLPPSVGLDYWADTTYYLNERLNMMLKNVGLGAILVFVLLGLFLHLRVAIWVCVGLPVAFLGALWLLPTLGVSLNLVSLFGFILVIGVVVDDAIVIAESAHAETERNGYTIENIIRGARRVAVPATFGVLTTVAAFVPMLIAQGRLTVMFQAIGFVVVLCLLFSLVESKLILPSHMALMKGSSGRRKGIADATNRGLDWIRARVYVPSLQKLLQYRYATVCSFFALLLLTIGFYLSPFLNKSFFPTMESDFMQVRVNIMDGMPEHYIIDVAETIVAGMQAVNEQVMATSDAQEAPIKHVFAWIGSETSARMFAELAKPEARTLKPTEIAAQWRAQVGNLAGTTELIISGEQRLFSGSPIAFNLTSKNFDALDAAAEELAAKLEDYGDVYEVRTPIATGPDEIQLHIKPEGIAVGLTLSRLARQVREAFFGVEAQRLLRGETEYRVIVRYPKTERVSIGNLENMWVRLPDGRETPFGSVADYTISPGYGSITRVDGKRSMLVSGEADLQTVDPVELFQDLQTTFFPSLKERYPSVSVARAGSLQDQLVAMNDLGLAMIIALSAIYILLAIPLRSYVQPLIIMSVIPFGLIGAVVGHALLGAEFNISSNIGCIALTGVVVNDSLILVHYYNRKRRTDNASMLSAILSAGKARLRAIVLTSLTTFFGLVPILLETSLQAKIVANMAISLGFGILFATVITLILIPCLLRIGGDITRVNNADVLPESYGSIGLSSNRLTVSS